MADLPITLTCTDYARVMPLATGDVKPDGIDLTLIHGTAGSWEMRAEMLRRALDDPNVQGGEGSMAGHLRRIDKGDRSHVGLPVFPLRNFTARDLYVRKGGLIESPADLIGKRVGMYDWVASGSMWYRHFLRFVHQFAAAQRGFPYVSPWLDVELGETEALMGADFYADGFEKNRKAVETFCHQAHELGIVSRPITAEQYFAEYLAS
jgi:hypothetical protein